MNPAYAKVLLVDDDPDMLRLVSQALKREGYSVETAGDGELALAALERACPDFLITDWEMPKLNGLDLCRRMRTMSLPSYVYVLMLTGKSGAENLSLGVDAGVNDFVTKPFQQAELMARMRAGELVLELERRLTHLARHDGLTGLPVRASFHEQLAREIERSRRHDHTLSCAILDVDFFKRINDEFGHPTGDAVLKAIAKTAKECCRTTDLVARFGGEEFCALLPDTNEDEAMVWAERLRKAIAAQTFKFDGKDLRVTASLGISEFRSDVACPNQLVDEADQALLVAKQSGRNRVIGFRSLLDVAKDGGVEARTNDPFEGMTARDCMTSAVACLRGDESVGEAVEFLTRLRINSAPVVDDEGLLIGILSEKDILSALVTPELWSRPVREVMQANVVCYDEDTPLRKIYEFLCRVTIRRLAIVESGKPVGILDRGSLLRWFENWLSASGRKDSLRGGDYSPSNGRPVTQPIQDTAKAIVEEAHLLQESISLDPKNSLAAVVGRSSRMQDLLNDLLAYSSIVSTFGKTEAGYNQLTF